MAHDVFVNFSAKDAPVADAVVAGLENKGIRCQVAPRDLKPGMDWGAVIAQAIESSKYEAIDDCREIATFFSPTYLDSKVCLEEFNIALCHHRESEIPILKPIYLYSANLPTYMRIIQFFDCRESNRDKLQQAATYLIQS